VAGDSATGLAAGMTTRDRPRFPVIEGQRRLATRRQLVDVGFTRSAVDHALRRDWQLVLPGVVAAHRGPLDADTRLAAAALWAGPQAVLTGGVALDRHGLPGAGRDEALFLVPSSARARSTGAVRSVRTSRAITVAAESGCVRMVSLERALVDHALRQQPAVPHTRSARDLKALTIAALQRGLTSTDRLEAELGRAWARGVEPIRGGLDSFAKGAWSLPEDALLTLLGSSPELRGVLLNKTLATLDGTRLGTPDVFFPAAGVAGQVHSKQHHSGYAEDGTDLWSLTVEKDGAFTDHDIIVIGVTPRSLAQRPQAVLDRFRRVVSRNLGRSYGPVMIDDVVYGLGDGVTLDDRTATGDAAS
jgi:hypothetical protein